MVEAPMAYVPAIFVASKSAIAFHAANLKRLQNPDPIDPDRLFDDMVRTLQILSRHDHVSDAVFIDLIDHAPNFQPVSSTSCKTYGSHQFVLPACYLRTTKDVVVSPRTTD